MKKKNLYQTSRIPFDLGIFPNKHFYSLVSTPFWYLKFTSIFCSDADYAFLCCCLKQILRIDTEKASSKDAIWDELSLPKHQKKHHNKYRISTFYMQIRCRFSAHLSWVGPYIPLQRILYLLTLYLSKKKVSWTLNN